MSLNDDLAKIPNVVLHLNCDLTGFSTFRLKSFGDLAVIQDVDSLKLVLALLKRHSRSYRLIGWGANQVLATVEKDFLIKLDLPSQERALETYRESYDLPASIGLNHLTSHAVRFNVGGWEVFTGIPASLGGAIAMNAGTALGEIGSLVRSVEIMNSLGELRTEVITPQSFSYRKNHFLLPGDVVISARLGNKGFDPTIGQKIKDYIAYRKKTQPLATKNCGCVFKNYDQNFKAGKFIDQSGLKGLSVGALSVSTLHANFMENKGQASYDDFCELTRLINQQMKLHWGIEFELEVKSV
jgi:UDP-N-acetylmuramate dehydrogenase